MEKFLTILLSSDSDMVNHLKSNIDILYKSCQIIGDEMHDKVIWFKNIKWQISPSATRSLTG